MTLLNALCKISLPFTLTGAQQRVIKTLLQRSCPPHPMMRLVQGDVGSGKTVVAAAAAIHGGCQSAARWPSWRQRNCLPNSICRISKTGSTPLGIHVGWLSGKVKGKARKQILQALHHGELPLVIGTHALFQEEVEFKRLGLVIIDEQHRFGVHQRLALRDKGRHDERSDLTS